MINEWIIIIKGFVSSNSKQDYGFYQVNHYYLWYPFLFIHLFLETNFVENKNSDRKCIFREWGHTEHLSLDPTLWTHTDWTFDSDLDANLNYTHVHSYQFFTMSPLILPLDISCVCLSIISYLPFPALFSFRGEWEIKRRCKVIVGIIIH